VIRVFVQHFDAFHCSADDARFDSAVEAEEELPFEVGHTLACLPAAASRGDGIDLAADCPVAGSSRQTMHC